MEVVTLAVTTIRLTFIFIAVSASMIFPALVAASMQEACWYLGGGRKRHVVRGLGDMLVSERFIYFFPSDKNAAS